jgi:hypothetical protein
MSTASDSRGDPRANCTGAQPAVSPMIDRGRFPLESIDMNRPEVAFLLSGLAAGVAERGTSPGNEGPRPGGTR